STVVFRWKQPYPRGGNLEAEDFQALPSHILQSVFDPTAPDAFISHPFWGAGYIGLGPYRADHWEFGAFVDASAFSDHALGRPRIDAIRLRFMADPNAVVAGLLAGDLHGT